LKSIPHEHTTTYTQQFCNHSRFQEYLAALHIKEEKLETVLLDKLSQSWWHETARLYAAQADASAIVRTCLAPDPPSVEMLVVAHECIEEALEVNDVKLREELDNLLSRGVENSDPDRRRLAAEVLLALRLRRMVRVEEDKYIDPTFVTHAEYQLFLDEMRDQERYLQPDHWTEYTFPTGRGALPIFIASGTFIICQAANDKFAMFLQIGLAL